MAEGFGEVLFSSVQVNASAEIAYRFNLEPAHSGRTLVDQRRDREQDALDDVAAHCLPGVEGVGRGGTPPLP